ncbi:tRNA uridine(34) 5-carboxymethylaminomethyl modification radical SAM/GNAT enzyme Elp3 [Candidatus Bathyarchaeota archaeon]|nr:tRNA uridine(34) 5-carboxymethylaminomethyl modification radical SAM/GNAT enzyme Elp3 [Candidatus Bathyarchaeota archaeon]
MLSLDVRREFLKELEKIDLDSLDSSSVHKLKMAVAKRLNLPSIPSNSELISSLPSPTRERLLPILRRKPVRSASGILVVAVMTKPMPCPKPEPCIYCPGGPGLGVPQSYTGHEPAAMRGIQNKFDPYLQVRHRLRQFEAIGHRVDKVELIVMGGTFPAAPVDYQRWFIKRCLDALSGTDSRSLEEAKSIAEASKIHNVGITVETRPDWAKEKHVDQMLSLGVTRVELGVQNVYDDIYELVNRGHKVEDVVEATRILKDSGLKVGYHLMPGLPGSDFDRDLEAFRKVFSDPRFKPDFIKIYPCLVIKGTKLYELWRRGEYRPYTTEEAVELIAQVKRFIPSWVRVMRVQRDIPSNLIVAGVKKSNLRELVHRKLEELGVRCRCIRCREVGHRMLKEHVEPKPEFIELLVHEEEASGGKDFFISVEDVENDVLLGYLRLRIPSPKAHRPEINLREASIVRELRVLGSMLPVGFKPDLEIQHRGYGKALLEKAEELSVEEGAEKMLVTSALGTKRYYLKLGFRYDGPYVSKMLKG